MRSLANPRRVVISIFSRDGARGESYTLSKGIVSGQYKADGIDEYGPIVARYGRPQPDDSTEYDDLRPLIVTRFIEYHPEDVKIAFVPITRADQLPPVVWKLTTQIRDSIREG